MLHMTLRRSRKVVYGQDSLLLVREMGRGIGSVSRCHSCTFPETYICHNIRVCT